jgi:hypothetical protein
MLATLSGSATLSSWRMSSLKRIFLSVPVGMVSGNMHQMACGGVRACVRVLVCCGCFPPPGHGVTVVQAHVEIEPLWPWPHRHVSSTGPRHRVCTCADKVSCGHEATVSPGLHTNNLLMALTHSLTSHAPRIDLHVQEWLRLRWDSVWTPSTGPALDLLLQAHLPRAPMSQAAREWLLTSFFPRT